MPNLNAGHRRALELLANTSDGCTEALMLAQGLTPKLIGAVVRAGHATARPERMIVAGNAVSVTRIKITESRHEALAVRGWFGRRL